MSKIPLEQCFTHTTIFLNGKNLGLNLHPKATSGMTLEYDTDEKMLTVSYGERYLLVPLANIAGMLPFKFVEQPVFAYNESLQADHKLQRDADKFNAQLGALETQKPIPAISTQPVKAQVETPQGHVFEGPGKGRR